MPMSSDLAIRVDGVFKAFNLPRSPLDKVLNGFTFGALGRTVPHEVLNGVSFDVRRGETIALLGTNGAGKSTLLQMIAGTMSPTSGNIEVRGRVAALLELGAGFSPDFTGRENAILNARLMGIDDAEARLLLPWIIDFSGIGESIDRPVRFYSSGMFVRLAFAVAAAVRPDIMIIDEALGVGDAVFQAKCYRYLKHELKDVTKLLVSHDSALVGALADRAVLLGAGRVIYDGPLRAGLDAYERAANDASATLTGSSEASGSGYSVGTVSIAVGGRSVKRTVPGDLIEVKADIESAHPDVRDIFVGLRVFDVSGQCVLSNDHHRIADGQISLLPGSNGVSLHMEWPALRRGSYILDVAISHLPSEIESAPTPTGAFRQVTLDCMARAGGGAILVQPVRVGRSSNTARIAS